MGYSNPVGDVLGFFLCLWLCDNLWRPRRRVVYATQPVVYAQAAPVPVVVRPAPAPVTRTVYYASEAPEPAPLPALALEVPPPVPPKAEVVERV